MLSPRCQSPHLSTWHYTASPDSRMSSHCPWESLIISHYSLPSIIWSSPGFRLLKTEWTHPEWFSTLCNMLPLCRSFTSLNTQFTECLFCAGDTEMARTESRPPQRPHTSLSWPYLSGFQLQSERSTRQTKVHLFPSLVSFPWLFVSSLSLWTCPKSRPVWKAAWHSGKGGSHGTGWEILGKLLPYSDFDFFTVKHRLRVWSQTA